MSDTQEKVAKKGWRERLPLIERAVESVRPAVTAHKATASTPAPAARPVNSQAAAGAPKQDAGERTLARQSRYAEIDLNRLESLGLLTPNGSRSRTKEEFRVIKRAILQDAFRPGAHHGLPGNLVMVTSAKPAEGKSFTAVNLAISIALERDYTVLLIDGDLARPNVMNMLGLKSDKGIIEVLEGTVPDLSDVLIRTNIDKLSILPAGAAHNLGTELLASHRMSNLVTEIAQRYRDRIVIFDAPPVLSTSEPSALAMHVGQIVMVVEADKTPKSAVKEALGMLNTGAKIGLILNRCPTRLGQARFGSYYHRDT